MGDDMLSASEVQDLGRLFSSAAPIDFMCPVSRTKGRGSEIGRVRALVCVRACVVCDARLIRDGSSVFRGLSGFSTLLWLIARSPERSSQSLSPSS